MRKRADGKSKYRSDPGRQRKGDRRNCPDGTKSRCCRNEYYADDSVRKNEQSQSADTGRAWRCAHAGRELDASVYILQTMPGRCLWSDMNNVIQEKRINGIKTITVHGCVCTDKVLQ